ncbi:DUF2463 domain-containing protein [Encephalitozoon hellem]|uniref:DUF2463 domain-containing protein n=1 Tax=Encephalitozoon hellem TaxID=27973 RepID=A0A9Q9C9B9_ENCHE|nr:DUF2463 domain-containing protein [Encephalitozoon hellem]
MGSISTLKLHLDDNLSNENRKLSNIIIVHGFKELMSIGFPILISLLLGEKVKDSLQLKFIVVLFPFLYSAVSLLIWKKSELSRNSLSSRLQKTFYFLSNALILLSIFISILSVVVFTFEEWDDEGMVAFPMLFPSLVVLPTYLLSISCRITSGSIFFVDNGVDIFIDLAILLCPLAGVVILGENFECIPYFSAASLLLFSTRLLRERYSLLTKKSAPTVWRQCAFIFILISIAFSFWCVGYECATIINRLTGYSIFRVINNVFSES